MVARTLELKHDNQDTGNGALKAVRSYFTLHPNHDPSLLLTREDHMLAWLWSEGFKLVPVDSDEEEPQGPDFGVSPDGFPAAVVISQTSIVSDAQGRLWHVNPGLGSVKRLEV